MKYCDNVNCEWADEPIKRISDYRIVDGAVLCVACYEEEEDNQQEYAANAPDWN